jgi:hypothetical protein
MKFLLWKSCCLHSKPSNLKSRFFFGELGVWTHWLAIIIGHLNLRSQESGLKLKAKTPQHMVQFYFSIAQSVLRDCTILSTILEMCRSYVLSSWTLNHNSSCHFFLFKVSTFDLFIWAFKFPTRTSTCLQIPCSIFMNLKL